MFLLFYGSYKRDITQTDVLVLLHSPHHCNNMLCDECRSILIKDNKLRFSTSWTRCDIIFTLTHCRTGEWHHADQHSSEYVTRNRPTNRLYSQAIVTLRQYRQYSHCSAFICQISSYVKRVLGLQTTNDVPDRLRPQTMSSSLTSSSFMVVITWPLQQIYPISQYNSKR